MLAVGLTTAAEEEEEDRVPRGGGGGGTIGGRVTKRGSFKSFTSCHFSAVG